MRKSYHSKSWSEEVVITLFYKITQLHSFWSDKKVRKIGQKYPKRTGKQCRERWHNHLNPNIVKNAWTNDEEETLFQLQKLHGNKWTMIAEKLPGRTDNSIKNHFYSTIRKSLRRIIKYVGSQKPTLKMRGIKPKTLSQIFSLAQDKQQLEQQNPESINYKQIANNLIRFSRLKVSKNQNQINEEQMKNFSNLINQMEKVNKYHQNQKVYQNKLKKQKRLTKNFDQVSLSEQSDDQQDSIDIQQKILNKNKQKQIQFDQQHKKQQKIAINNKKNIDPKQYHSKNSPKQKKFNNKKLKTKDEYKICITLPTINQVDDIEKLPKSQTDEKFGTFFLKESNYMSNQQPQTDKKQATEEQNVVNFDWVFDVQHMMNNNQQSIQSMLKICQFNISPIDRFKITPQVQSPGYQRMYQLKGHPLKNQQFNETLNRIKDQIKHNISNQLQVPEKPIMFQSPSSAFRRPSDFLAKFQSS